MRGLRATATSSQVKSFALALALFVPVFACKKDTTDTEPGQAEIETGARKRVLAKAVPPDAAPPPPVDAAPLSTEVLENPLEFAVRESAEHRRRLPMCPRREGPCIAGFDFTYFVYDSGWRHYYTIDPGIRTSPLYRGGADSNSVNHRMSAAVAAVLRKERKTKALLSCGSAARFHEVAGLDRFVTIDVSAQGVELPPSLEPLKKTTATGANELIAGMYAELDPNSFRPQGPFFSERELASMVENALSKPRIERSAMWLGNDKKVKYGRFTVVYSPVSNTVYIDKRIDNGKLDDILAAKNLEEFSDEDLARVRALVRTLDLKKADLAVGSLCELGKLGGYERWIPFENTVKFPVKGGAVGGGVKGGVVGGVKGGILGGTGGPPPPSKNDPAQIVPQ